MAKRPRDTKRRIVELLRQGPKTYEELAKLLDRTPSYVSRLIGDLVEAKGAEFAGFGKRLGARGVAPSLWRLKEKSA